MKKYVFEGKDYFSLWAVRNAAPYLIFSDDAPADLLERTGIAVMEIPDPEPDPEEQARLELELKLAAIDQETSAAIMAGFDYEIGGETFRFHYDRDDQLNFESGATGCLIKKAGAAGLPDTAPVNAYRADGGMVRLELGPDEFLALYGAALAHKAACLEAGGRKKAALMAQAEEKEDVQ